MQIATVIQYEAGNRGERTELLRAACRSGCQRVIPILFCCMADAVPDGEAELLEVIRQNREPLRTLSAQVLSDFYYELWRTGRENFIRDLTAIYTDREMLYTLETMPVEQGTLSLRALLTVQLKIGSAQGLCEDYLQWVQREEKFSFTHQKNGLVTDSDNHFVDSMAATLLDDENALGRLQQLWLKKASVYYTWRSDDGSHQNDWFEHIGLILWLVAVNRLPEHPDEHLAMDVLRTLNDYIPSTLRESSCQLLMINVFYYGSRMGSGADELLTCLTGKISRLPLLCDCTKVYLEQEKTTEKVLAALRERLMLLARLPNKRQAGCVEQAQTLINQCTQALENDKAATQKRTSQTEIKCDEKNNRLGW
ncbi:MAG: hypothetical protein LKJ86_05750 [Oscillibacter sp.]|nr:hypothetical protein [Oscillibacter sp.]